MTGGSSSKRCRRDESPPPFLRLGVSPTVDGDIVRFEDRAPSFGNGVYRIGDASILVLNHLWPRSRVARIRAARPPSITGIVAMAVLPSKESLARIIVDVVDPLSLASTTVALAAVHANKSRRRSSMHS